LLPDDHDKLVAAGKTGDLDAQTKLVEFYSTQVQNLIFSILRDANVVEDLAQETFIRMIQSLPGYESRAPFKAWLFRIAVNLCRDHLRKKKVRRIMHRFEVDPESGEEQQFTDDQLNPLQNAEQSEQMKLIKRALDKIPDASRTVFILREIEQLSYEEIAQTLSWRLGTVKSRLFRARKELAEILGPQLEVMS